jgi:hypothetical protein
MSEPNTTPLAEAESHEILLAAARHCIADIDRDVAIARSRGYRTSLPDLERQRALFTDIEKVLYVGQPRRRRARSAA